MKAPRQPKATGASFHDFGGNRPSPEGPRSAAGPQLTNPHP
jgi:hypothetical protein